MSDRRLNLKRVKDTIIWLSLIAGIAALLFFSVLRKSNAEVKTLVVEIEKINDGEQLISEKEIKQILQLAAGKTITKANIKSLNLRKLEAKAQNMCVSNRLYPIALTTPDSGNLPYLKTTSRITSGEE